MTSIQNLRVDQNGALTAALDCVAERLAVDGAIVLRGYESAAIATCLRAEADRLLQEDIGRNGTAARHHGVVYALMARSRLFLDYMVRPSHLALFRRMLGHGCIVHHYCVSAVPPAGGRTYATDLHRDVPASRLIPGYPTNIALFLALEDMDASNGGLQLLPGSHLSTSGPPEAEGVADIVTPRLQKGDAVVFDARTLHRGGHNETQAWRFGLSLQACRAYMRQLFDYPRLMSGIDLGPLSPVHEQFLGCHVRMPTSLAEFDLPPEQRPYRAGQE